jgi:hypothetical protein
MKKYSPTSTTKKIVFAVATVVVAVGILETVVGGMMNPSPESMAARQHFIAVEAERAQKMRALEREEVRFAADGVETLLR